MLKLNYRVCIYKVNPNSEFYNLKRVKYGLGKFIEKLNIPYKIRNIYVEDIRNITIHDLKPLEESFNIVLIPTKVFYFDFFFQAGKIVVFINFDCGKSELSQGFYYPQLTIIRYYLLEGKILDLNSRLYKWMNRDGRILMIISAAFFDSIDTLTILYKRVRLFKLKDEKKKILRRIILEKKRQLLSELENQTCYVPNVMEKVI